MLPVFRLIVMLIVFIRLRDHRFIAITAAVLIIILMSCALGIHVPAANLEGSRLRLLNQPVNGLGRKGHALLRRKDTIAAVRAKTLEGLTSNAESWRRGAGLTSRRRGSPSLDRAAMSPADSGWFKLDTCAACDSGEIRVTDTATTSIDSFVVRDSLAISSKPTTVPDWAYFLFTNRPFKTGQPGIDRAQTAAGSKRMYGAWRRPSIAGSEKPERIINEPSPRSISVTRCGGGIAVRRRLLSAVL